VKRAALMCLLAAGCATVPAGAPSGSIVIFVTTDGLRPQEVFGGAEKALMPKDAALALEFWRETPEERRAALMPFFWGTIAKEGAVWRARLTNGKKFSYPGYHELLAGFADPRIDSNAKRPNPNVTVLEWLNRRPGFEGRVAAFGTWDVLPYILNRRRSGLHIVAADEPIPGELTERERTINDLRRDTACPWDGNPLDGFTHHSALEHLKRHRPRILYILYGETDEWAHEGNYKQYLRAAKRVDRFVKQLWEAARDRYERVSIVFTTDHGRGSGKQWTDHNADVAGAEDMWMAAIGAGVAPRGERPEQVTQSQAAATVAKLAGEDYPAAVPAAAPPLPLD